MPGNYIGLLGIKAVFATATVELDASNDVDKVKSAASDADLIVVSISYTFLDKGDCTAPGFNCTLALKPVIPPDDGSEEANSVMARLMVQNTVKEEAGKGNYKWGTGGDRLSLSLLAGDVEAIKVAVQANSTNSRVNNFWRRLNN